MTKIDPKMSEKDQFFFQKEKISGTDLLSEIAHICSGLIYVSETDAPVVAYQGETADRVSDETLYLALGRKPGDQVERVSFDAFFSKLTTMKEWFGEVETERAKKYLELRKLLEANLYDPFVVRVGAIALNIFVLGIDREGTYMGVATKAVET